MNKPKPRPQAEIEQAVRPFVDILQIQQAVSGKNPLPNEIIPTQAICMALLWALGYDDENFEGARRAAEETVDELKTLAGWEDK